VTGPALAIEEEGRLLAALFHLVQAHLVLAIRQRDSHFD
jgi:hypothetical protein